VSYINGTTIEIPKQIPPNRDPLLISFIKNVTPLKIMTPENWRALVWRAKCDSLHRLL
jgi:hypothetical protein